MGSSKKIKLVFFISAIVLGLIQVWNTRFYMNPDGVSYLDIGDVYFRGDFKSAINAYWSPFYSWILGLVLYLVKPSFYYEFPLVHGVNFLIYLIAIFCFSFFMDELIVFVKHKKLENFILLPDWSIYSIGYMLFLYTTLKFITLWMTTPDLLLALFIYLTFGLLLRIRNNQDFMRNYICLGILLGVSYLIKAVMFPVGFIVLFSNIYRKNYQKTFASLFCFLLISLPFVVFISNQKSRITFGDTGTLNYVWQVNNITPFYMAHWQGDLESGGVGELEKRRVGKPVHPTRKIFSSPDVFEFNGPINATYPPWFDPSYWYEGIKPNFNHNDLVRFFKDNLKEYFSIFIIFQGVLIACFIYLCLRVSNKREFLGNVFDKSFLLTPSIFTILIYSFVYPELRYIAPFVVTVWVVLFSSLIFKDSNETNHSFKFATNLVLVFLFLIILTAKFTPSDYSYLRELFSTSANNNLNCRVAEELESIGIIKGDTVGTFGYGHYAFWARLAKLRIVAEMPDKEIKKFWDLNAKEKLMVINLFKEAGAKAIILDSSPQKSDTSWQKLGNTGFYVYLLN